FLLTFFRVNLAEKDEPPRQGFTLLAARLEEGSTRHEAYSWIDSAFMDRVVSLLGRAHPALDELYREALLDELYREALLEELSAGAPPEPILKNAEPVLFQEAPFSISWGGNALSYDDDGRLDLRFQEPGGGETLILRLDPARDYQDLLSGPDSAATGDTMGYHICTRMGISGQSGSGLPVQGEAWFEHQWMDSNWLCPRNTDQDSPTAWAWFGFSLDNGDDLHILVMWDVRSGERRFSSAMLQTAGGDRRDCHDITIETVRSWRSPATFVSYPVESRVLIPSLQADLSFRPITDEQEFHLFNPSRALWEGAGEVAGTIEGRPVRGVARAEFHGYGYILDYDSFLGDATLAVDEAIAAFLPAKFTEETAAQVAGSSVWKNDPDGLTETISRPVWDLLRRKGKRWRPLFGHFLLRALGGDGSRYDPLISITSELLHSGALIIDDIEDSSLLRRGEPCIHLRYGTDIAINAGSLLYFLPALALMEHPYLTSDQRLRLHEIKERVCIEAHCGQALDIHWSRDLTPDRLRQWMDAGLEDRILQMYNLKTGAGTRGVASAAVVLAQAEPDLEAACVLFARNYAVAFQIVDDIHNFSLSPAWTKTVGEDIANGKPTYVIVKALRLLPAPERDRLAEILCDHELRTTAEGREEGMALVRASGSLEACREEALRLTDEGWRPLAHRLPPSMAKILLRGMCRKMLQFVYES
ncbi:MAG: polyprenyl synthetase family protein, partial [Thermodesulfovibrionales bacterium]